MMCTVLSELLIADARLSRACFQMMSQKVPDDEVGLQPGFLVLREGTACLSLFRGGF